MPADIAGSIAHPPGPRPTCSPTCGSPPTQGPLPGPDHGPPGQGYSPLGPQPGGAGSSPTDGRAPRNDERPELHDQHPQLRAVGSHARPRAHGPDPARRPQPPAADRVGVDRRDGRRPPASRSSTSRWSRSAAASAASCWPTTSASPACAPTSSGSSPTSTCPWQTYEYLTKVSQIPRKERLRSDAQSMPDNIWGFPSFAFREAWTDKTIDPIWNVCTEPIFRDYYTPRAGQVFETMEREAHRIGYFDMTVKGQVRMVRRRYGGGYFTILTPAQGTTATKRVAYRSHLRPPRGRLPGRASSCPTSRSTARPTTTTSGWSTPTSPTSTSTRSSSAGPGVVMIRGGGIVASRVLQRLIDDRDRLRPPDPDPPPVPHLHRRVATGPSIFLRRKGGDGWAYQGFNWPKSSLGRPLQVPVREARGRRAQAASTSGSAGRTRPTASSGWSSSRGAGARAGTAPTSARSTRSCPARRHGRHQGEGQRRQPPRGPGPLRHRLPPASRPTSASTGCYADLLRPLRRRAQPLGRLDVERTFEVRGTQSAPGTMYAAGTHDPRRLLRRRRHLPRPAVRGRCAIIDDLASRGFVKKIGPVRSSTQWLNWARHKELPK